MEGDIFFTVNIMCTVRPIIFAKLCIFQTSLHAMAYPGRERAYVSYVHPLLDPPNRSIHGSNIGNGPLMGCGFASGAAGLNFSASKWKHWTKRVLGPGRG